MLDDVFEYGIMIDYDYYGNKRIVFDIAGLDMFEYMVCVYYGLFFVNFYVLWCLYCWNFVLIWEYVVEMVCFELCRIGRFRFLFGMVFVDCLMEKNDELCLKLYV